MDRAKAQFANVPKAAVLIIGIVLGAVGAVSLFVTYDARSLLPTGFVHRAAATHQVSCLSVRDNLRAALTTEPSQLSPFSHARAVCLLQL